MVRLPSAGRPALPLALLLLALGCAAQKVAPFSPSPPPGCQGRRCGPHRVCVLQQRSRQAVPVCISDPCAGVPCKRSGALCVTVRRSEPQPACMPFTSCQFTKACVPRAKPKPGFCPAQQNVPRVSSSASCTYDNDCPSDLLCCRGSRGERSCTSPAYPDPCGGDKCRSSLFAPTCVVRNGEGFCLDRVCSPGSYYCDERKQVYCSQEGQITRTDLPC